MNSQERKKRKAKKEAKKRERYPNGDKYQPPLPLAIPAKGTREKDYTTEEAYWMGINPACTGLGRGRPILSVADWLHNVTNAVETYSLEQTLSDIISVMRLTCRRWYSEHPEKFEPATKVPITYWGTSAPDTELKFDESAREGTRIAMVCPIFCGIPPFRAAVSWPRWARGCITEFNRIGVVRGFVDMLAALKHAYGQRGVPKRKLVIVPKRDASIVTAIPLVLGGVSSPIRVIGVVKKPQ